MGDPDTPRPEISVILPTLNEAASLEVLRAPLVAAIAGYRSDVIVVDDASTDGTIPLVAGWERDGGFRLLVRTGRRGLSTAVLEGVALARGRAVVVMDADGSHSPSAIPSLVDPILDGRAEFVLGSRHVAGGGSPRLGFDRRAMSWAAAILARPLTGVRDPMSGFFAFSPAILDRARLDPVGYKVALEILVRCEPRPTLEVPIVFIPRIAGQSKLDSVQIGGYLRHLARLYGYRLFGPERVGAPLSQRAPHPVDPSGP